MIYTNVIVFALHIAGPAAFLTRAVRLLRTADGGRKDNSARQARKPSLDLGQNILLPRYRIAPSEQDTAVVML